LDPEVQAHRARYDAVAPVTSDARWAPENADLGTTEDLGDFENRKQRARTSWSA
jgi:hypothetical protein